VTLTAGTRLGPFEIVSLRGKGGMGEVYLARDTRLERRVAVKVLPPELGRDPHFRQRLEREAKTISQLTHPHVCRLYDIGAEDGVDYLVMEYLEGETLEERLARGALSLAEVIEIGTQIAEAIDAAHRAGVIHRDLKPGNVMLTRDGAKVVDFGLAKGLEARAAASSTQSPTLSQPLTSDGSILGTLLYMAPEQLEGREADARSDIWALGAVLHQMATGARPFEGSSQASLIAAIMTGQRRSLRELSPVVPARLEWVVERCLQKSPERRWQSARDVAIELQSLEEADLASVGAASAAGAGGAHGTAPARRRGARVAAALGATALLLGLGLGLGWLLRGNDAPRSAGPAANAWTVTTLAEKALPEWGLGALQIAPDGRTVLYTVEREGGLQLVRRSLDALDPEPVAGARGDGVAFFSPDGRRIAVRDPLGAVRTMPLEGGAPGTAVVTDAYAAMFWGDDGYLYYTPDGPGVPMAPGSVETWRVPAAGGERERVGPGYAAALLPDRRTLLTTLSDLTRQSYWGDVTALDLETGEARVLAPGAQPYYVDPGFLVFYRDGSLWAAPLAASGRELLAPPRAIESEVAIVAIADVGRYHVNRRGDLVYLRGRQTRFGRLVWGALDGATEPVTPEVKAFSEPIPSPDGRWVSTTVQSPDGFEQWLLDLSTGSWSRPTQSGGTFSAIWLPPRGSEILFDSTRLEGRSQVFVQPADRSRPAERLLPSESNQMSLDVSADGRWLLLFDFGGQGCYAFDRQTGETRTVVGEGIVYSAAFHPDGDWIVFAHMNKRGYSVATEIWLVPFPGPGEARQLSSGGGSEPRWSLRGDAIYYRGPSEVMAMPVERRGGDLVTGRARALFADRFLHAPTLGVQNFRPHPNGRFLMIEPADESQTSLVLVQNWRAKLERVFAEEMQPR
jgi:Tol biopolymer transport system component/tRNA A-37 threonylcarbamoyl transferase component Bud32